MRARLRTSDAGFTLIEVVVAMVVFAVVMTGFLYVVAAGLSATRDTRARVVAANLASQQIDLVRAAANVFDVTHDNYSYTTSLNGDTFHVDVSAPWHSTSGDTASCEAGAATGSLSYKKVTVTVTWDNMRDGAQPVYSDTSLTPSTKINDPNLGTILVGVVDAAGTGVSGATVSLTPANGIAAVTTDSDGCAYLLKVPADTYTVSVSKSGYINEQQIATPKAATVEVTGGSSSRLSFAYDRAITLNATYTWSGVTGTVNLPTNLTTTFLSTYGNHRVATTTAANPKSFSLYPISSGYSVVAGAYVETPESPSTSCLAPDPGQWEETPTLVGHRADPVAGTPGSTVAASVPMGVVRFSSANGTGNYLTAVYVGGGAGDPGCPAGMTYRFSNVISSSNGATVALPFGTWKLYRGSAAGSTTTQITGGTITPLTTGSKTGTGSDTVVTLDPRVAP